LYQFTSDLEFRQEKFLIIKAVPKFFMRDIKHRFNKVIQCFAETEPAEQGGE